MPEHTNFYESIQEARMRIRGTVVLYGDEPYYVFAVTDHRGDGVFRVYLQPLVTDHAPPPTISVLPADHPSFGTELDKWLDDPANAKSGWLRKRMDSKHFSKFRPFPLGMCNNTYDDKGKTRYQGTYYLERQPLRPKTEQGLTAGMLVEHSITAAFRKIERSRYDRTNVSLMSASFRDCVKAAHPSAEECLEALLDPSVENEAAAFHREFAFIRGPIDMIFLGYKADVIGVLPKRSLSHLRLGREFAWTKEVVESLGIFNDIQI